MSEQLPTVYVGPTSTKLGLARYTHYTTIPEQVEEAIRKNPALKLLMVPLDQFHDNKANILGGAHSSINHAIKQLQTDKVL